MPYSTHYVQFMFRSDSFDRKPLEPHRTPKKQNEQNNNNKMSNFAKRCLPI